MRRMALAVVSTCCALIGGLAFASAPAFAGYANTCSKLGTPAFCTAGTFKEPIGVAVDSCPEPQKAMYM